MSPYREPADTGEHRERLPDNNHPDRQKTIKLKIKDENPLPPDSVRRGRVIGKPVQLSGLPSVWWLDPRGNICQLAVQTNSDPEAQTFGTVSYGETIRRCKIAEGWVPWEDLPPAHAHLVKPESASSWHNGGRDAELAARRALAAEDVAEYNKTWDQIRHAQAVANAEALRIVLGEERDERAAKRRGGKQAEE